jgi:hypothetical protein
MLLQQLDRHLNYDIMNIYKHNQQMNEMIIKNDLFQIILNKVNSLFFFLILIIFWKFVKVNGIQWTVRMFIKKNGFMEKLVVMKYISFSFVFFLFEDNYSSRQNFYYIIMVIFLYVKVQKFLDNLFYQVVIKININIYFLLILKE